MKEIEKDFEDIRNTISNGRKYVVDKYSLKIVKIKQIIEIYNERLTKEHNYSSDGRNILFEGDDNNPHWCNISMMMTKAEAEIEAKRAEQEQKEKIRQAKYKRIEKLKQELMELEND